MYSLLCHIFMCIVCVCSCPLISSLYRFLIIISFSLVHVHADECTGKLVLPLSYHNCVFTPSSLCNFVLKTLPMVMQSRIFNFFSPSQIRWLRCAYTCNYVRFNCTSMSRIAFLSCTTLLYLNCMSIGSHNQFRTTLK